MVEYEIKLEITDILGEGRCPGGHKIGDVFVYPEDRGKICPTAFHTLFPTIRVMQSGGKMPWFETPDSHSNCCPDYKRPVVFKISRKQKSE
ncbi:MAG: TIGR04076 family protein [Candidatus Heimdallarchaeota archaeon]|nr:MAG: TIGR04076 family protein [Candidatus Heimdallarchaeota archaeon]